jgi:TDG/mug DNA glycosylase family protein
VLGPIVGPGLRVLFVGINPSLRSARWAPRLVAVVGLTAYRIAFRRPRATIGLQRETIGGRPLWVLPNPSGRTAGYQMPALARAFGDLRRFVRGGTLTRRR